MYMRAPTRRRGTLLMINIFFVALQMVQLHFLNFDFGGISECNSASISIFDGNYNRYSYRYRRSNIVRLTSCGRNLPGDFTSGSNEVQVEFKIDNVTAYEGFKILYQGLDRVAGTIAFHV